ncbi:hypothetical protein OsI_00543 [Oryza sativa Indica Group]|uniref:Uncharacterized protein n=1 Tax=Oryza sativa subsp. indica TaxID=39946 RepID=B8ADF7_ORYSI|nr:hypothetical protein OsI_00543 [Oryza sativa Indica Group]
MAAAKKEEEEEEASKLQLKPAGSKVFSKLLSRESAAAAPSFRVYYGVASAGSVPFLWESQPGTPKNAMSTQSPTCSSMRSLQGHGGGGRAFGDDDDDDDDDGGDDDMAASTACFRVRHESFRAIKNCRVAMTVRSAISSVAAGAGAGGHGSSAAVAQKAA